MNNVNSLNKCDQNDLVSLIENKSKNVETNSINKQYFGVSLPFDFSQLNFEDFQISSPKDLVFESAQEALKIVKKIKKSRFKAFLNYEDALNFSSEISPNSIDESSFVELNNSKINFIESQFFNLTYKGPTPVELAKFRKLIENGDFKSVEMLIDSNPRYLISSYETPVIVMEGPRYNCVHVSCKANKSDVLQLILKSITDKNYMKRLFCGDDDIAIIDRIDHIEDLYLNTPDKAAHDTPLHIACKFGCLECVEILLNNPKCSKKKINKFNKSAYEVICDRKINDIDLKNRIQQLFKSRYYVPIIRTEDNEATIGAPRKFRPEEKKVTAFAGPMPSSIAKDFYNQMKSPTSRSKIEVAIRLSDHSKGIERVARNQCKLNKIHWREYWPFLDEYIDLTSKSGLKRLEKHFRKIYNKLDNENNSFNISLLCEKIENININSTMNFDDEQEIFYSACSTPVFEIEFYVNGNSFSEMDIDASIALQDTHIDKEQYPLINNWFNRVFPIMSNNKHSALNLSLNMSNLSFNSSYQENSSCQKKTCQLKDLLSPNILINESNVSI